MRPTAASSVGAWDRAVPWAWVGVALLAHAGWGAYPVLGRYLQTISDLPSMALLSLGNLVALLVYAPFVLHRVHARFLRSPVIWAFALIVVLRATTNLLAARFTSAIYVQLITLMTPLLVALLSAGLFRERLPRYTWPAIICSIAGAVLMMSGDISLTSFQLALAGSDWLGITMALTSMVCLSIYMLLVPRTVTAAVPAEAVLLVQLVTLTISSALFSLVVGEDWGRYAAIGLADWLVFAAFVAFVLLGANQFQIAALRRLGAPLVTSMMASRLVITLALAAMLLEESLTSPWQFLGAGIVLATISAYLWQQRPREARGVPGDRAGPES